MSSTSRAALATLLFAAMLVCAACAPEAAPDAAADTDADVAPAQPAAPAPEPAAPAAHVDPLAAGQAFLEQNGQRAEVVTTASGLQYEVLASGVGETPGPRDQVTTHYHGTLIDGRVFDSSVERGEPSEFPVNRVIKGWTEALQLMQVGDKWKLYVPPELAYGERGAGNLIGPNETLIFEVELLAVRRS